MGTLEVIIKRISPNILLRIYTGLAFGFYAFLALSTIGGLFFTLFPPQQTFYWYEKVQLIGIIALIGLSIAYVRGKQKLIPDIIIDEISSDENKYTVHFCNTEGLREADEMTKPYFGSGFIPFDRVEQWRLKNEKGFVQINNSEGLLCACFVILGLERSFFDQFIAGRVTEHDIDSNVILPFESMRKEERIYISGVVVREPSLYMGHKRATIMLWTMLQYIKRVFKLRKPRTFYAVGLTKESEKLLKTMGFVVCCNKGNRKDNSNLYKIDLDKKTWEELVAKIGDYSKMVSFNIDL